jgi:hypothetical protein
MSYSGHGCCLSLRRRSVLKSLSPVTALTVFANPKYCLTQDISSFIDGTRNRFLAECRESKDQILFDATSENIRIDKSHLQSSFYCLGLP